MIRLYYGCYNIDLAAEERLENPQLMTEGVIESEAEQEINDQSSKPQVPSSRRAEPSPLGGANEISSTNIQEPKTAELKIESGK